MDDRRRDGGTNYTLRTKEQGTHLTLNEHDDDDDNNDKECTTHCGIPNAHNNRSKVQKTVNNTECVCMGLFRLSGTQQREQTHHPNSDET